jgi:hypothetical protein
MRRLFALAVVVLHVLLVALLLSGIRVRVLPETESRVFVSLWFPVVEPEPQDPLRIETTLAPAAPRKVVPRNVAPAPGAQTPDEPAVATNQAESAAIILPAPATVDWGREASLAARRAALQNGGEEQKTFSPPPKPLPKPCKPKESSMEWNGDEDRAVTWAGPLPVFKVGKRCVVTIGFFACNLSEIPEANSHLLDDMRKPDRATSSVPDPSICD